MTRISTRWTRISSTKISLCSRSTCRLFVRRSATESGDLIAALICHHARTLGDSDAALCEADCGVEPD